MSDSTADHAHGCTSNGPSESLPPRPHRRHVAEMDGRRNGSPRHTPSPSPRTSEGFAPLPRRLDEERPDQPRPLVEAIADVRTFSLAPRRFTTQCGGLFLFVPDLV